MALTQLPNELLDCVAKHLWAEPTALLCLRKSCRGFRSAPCAAFEPSRRVRQQIFRDIAHATVTTRLFTVELALLRLQLAGYDRRSLSRTACFRRKLRQEAFFAALEACQVEWSCCTVGLHLVEQAWAACHGVIWRDVLAGLRKKQLCLDPVTVREALEDHLLCVRGVRAHGRMFTYFCDWMACNSLHTSLHTYDSPHDGQLCLFLHQAFVKFRDLRHDFWKLCDDYKSDAECIAKAVFKDSVKHRYGKVQSARTCRSLRLQRRRSGRAGLR